MGQILCLECRDYGKKYIVLIDILYELRGIKTRCIPVLIILIRMLINLINEYG